MGLYLGGLIIGRIFVSEIWGGGYFPEGLIFFFFWGGGGWCSLSEFNGSSVVAKPTERKTAKS